MAIRNQTPYESCHRLGSWLKSSGTVLVVFAEKTVTIETLIKLAMEGMIALEAKPLLIKTTSRGVTFSRGLLLFLTHRLDSNRVDFGIVEHPIPLYSSTWGGFFLRLAATSNAIGCIRDCTETR